jgi:voltage-gated potassium channel
MNERTLLTLGLLLGVGSGKPPDEWLASANGFLREKQASDPMGSALATVLAGAAAFYAAEREHNPKVNSFFDALVYVSTNLSVGYSDIFAKTEAGKAIGTALMTYGPALAARVFDPPNEAKTRALEASASDQSLRDIADKLELILNELRAGRTVRVGPAPGSHG